MSTNCLFDCIVLGKHASEDGCRWIVLCHVRDASLFDIHSSVALLRQLNGLVSEHVLVAHVVFLQLLLGHLDSIGVFLLHLLVLEVTFEDLLSAESLLHGQTLRLNRILHQILIFLQDKLHVQLTEFD